MFNKIKRYYKDPMWALGSDLIKKYPNFLSDKIFIETLWRMVMGYKLDLLNPRTFNEKLQWLKLYDHNPLYTNLVDKIKVKEYVTNTLGKEYVVPTLKVYNTVNDIDLDELPEKFVLKCNHDSGSVYICRDRTKFDIEDIKHKMFKHLSHNFYWDAREWAYKKVKPCVFAETFLVDDNFDDLVTYKFLCFDGEPRIMYATVKNDVIWENYYDMSFNLLPIHRKWPNNALVLRRPTKFEEMINVARKLSKGIPHVRIDLYEVKGQIYLSEYTFYDWGGLIDFDNNEWNLKLGDWIKLPHRKK